MGWTEVQEMISTLLLIASALLGAGITAAGFAAVPRRDELTGLLDYLSFKRAVERSIGAGGDKMIAVFFIDLNGFKQVNDTYGHTTGDEVLVQAAHRITANVRPGDAVCRRSGDEFLVCCVADSYVEVKAIHSRLGDALSGPYRTTKEPMLQGVVSAAVGMGVFRANIATVSALLETADAAMYAVKRKH